jgi:putative Mg2+ transporter-C (MgtC) family protein
MQTSADWPDIALRLLLSVIASAAIGINRGEADRPVGLRTTMLATLAAAISMVQVSLLLPIAGKAQDSFVVMDLMRLPLGILSGMGFIGAGAIIRRDNMVQGVTTAATLWFATVMGLCFGGGQIALGLAAFALAVFVRWPLKSAEQWAGQRRRGVLSITTNSGELVEQVVLPSLARTGFSIGPCAISFNAEGKACTTRCDIRWHEGRSLQSPVDLVRELARNPDISAQEWVPLEHQ